VKKGLLVLPATLAIAYVASCSRNDHPLLRQRNALACKPDAYLLKMPATGGFVLNTEPRDSVGIARWLRDVLPHRTGSGRYVNIEAGSDRSADLRWLVPEIERAGGEAYEFDPTCRIEISARASD
jgi:hypothetical protein